MIRHLLLLVAAASCLPEVPALPSFQQDVMPILAANCIRCHGYPALGGSPPSMRLDVYGDIAIDDTTRFSGAAGLAGVIAARVASESEPMPPRFPLDDFQIETLQRWARGVAPGEPAPRGAPRPNNRQPHITAERVGQTGNIVSLRIAIDDSDGDLVAGELRAIINGSERILGPVQSGLAEVRWNATGVEPGAYPVSAHLDDGAQVHVIAVGSITVGGS